MRSVVDFDHELWLRRAEVNDVELLRSVSEKDLSAKGDSKASAPQRLPKARFMRRGVMPHACRIVLETETILLGGTASGRRERGEVRASRQRFLSARRKSRARTLWRRIRDSVDEDAAQRFGSWRGTCAVPRARLFRRDCELAD